MQLLLEGTKALNMNQSIYLHLGTYGNRVFSVSCNLRILSLDNSYFLMLLETNSLANLNLLTFKLK